MRTQAPKVVVTCASLCLAVIGLSAAAATPATGPLRASQANPRYFADPTGKVIYLTGSHTWNNLQDMGPTDPPPAFDFRGYLDFLERHHHNFIRLWRWELVRWNTSANKEKESRLHLAAPHPWARNGSGTALDGKPRFDLGTFDEAYFTRLRSRVAEADRRGIYVAIMLFEGWGLQFVPEGWKWHPFNPANHSSGIGGGVKADSKGLTIFTLAHPDVTRVQEAYVRKVIDTVNDLDNVLYEISNENHPPSTEWQYHFIRFIHDYERTLPKQHPVGMTFQYEGGANATLLASPADWISPNPDAPSGHNYRDNPPPADGRKVILADTDHLWGVGGDVAWAWKSFLRGLNPIFMDPYDRKILDLGTDDQWEPVRAALGHTRQFAERLNLAIAVPHPDLASTGYCLAHPGVEYLVFQPKAEESFLVDLKPGTYRFQWFDADKGVVAGEGRMESVGGRQEFKAPLSRNAVLELRVNRPGRESARPATASGHASVLSAWQKALGDAELREVVRGRALDIGRRYRGRFAEYDLNNEMLHADYYAERLGPGITQEMARWIREGDPNAVLFLNDYDILNGRLVEAYVAHIRRFLDQGVPFGGIGVQGHMHADSFDPVALQRALDRLAELKLPIRVTEFNFPGQRSKYYDQPGAQLSEAEEQAKAEALAQYYRTCFAHPAVVGILMRGFWEGASWIPVSALYRRDWTPTPAALAYRHLVFREWWTDWRGRTDAQGRCEATVFFGKHRITAGEEVVIVEVKRAEGAREVRLTPRLPAPSHR